MTYKVKVKFALEQVMKAQKGCSGRALLFLLTSAPDGVGGRRHAPAALPRERPGTNVHEAGRNPGPVRTGAENLAPHHDSVPGPSSP